MYVVCRFHRRFCCSIPDFDRPRGSNLVSRVSRTRRTKRMRRSSTVPSGSPREGLDWPESHLEMVKAMETDGKIIPGWKIPVQSSGWWFQPLWKTWFSQLGLWFPVYTVPNHKPNIGKSSTLEDSWNVQYVHFFFALVDQGILGQMWWRMVSTRRNMQCWHPKPKDLKGKSMKLGPV